MEETTLHCLVQCSFAQACGSAVGLDAYIVAGDDFSSWLEGVVLQINSSRAVLIVMLLWAV